jgi:hypothetical protein
MTRFPLMPLSVLVALTAQPLPLLAQTNAVLKGLEGKRVRLTAAIVENDDRTGAVAVQGTVFEIRGDTIHVLQDGGQAAHLPLSGVRTLHIYGGKDHGKGAYWGALAGAAVGAFVSFLTEPECDGNGYGVDCRSDGSKPTYVEYVWSYASPFAFLGSIYGAIRGVDRWNPVITPQRVTIAPAKNGGIRIALSF